MNKLFYLAILLFSLNSYSQINATPKNYYDYFSDGKNLKGKQLTTAWLKSSEVADILSEEMKKAGFEWISNYSIIKIDTNTYVTSICFSEKSRFGFVFEDTHNMFPKKETRALKSMYKDMTGNDYAEKILSLDGESEFIKIKELPKNLYILKSDPYWYQFTTNPDDNKKLITKEIIKNILREDIREILDSAKK